MRSRLLMLLIMACLALPILAIAPVMAMDRPTLLVLGDSLSAAHGIPLEAGWVALLADRLERRDPPWRVVNASAGGETTRGGLSRLPALLQRHEPQVVVLALGGNDGLRGISPDEARDNLEALVGTARKAGARVLLVGIRVPPNLGRRYAERFHGIYHQLAESQDVPLVPFLLEGVALEAGMMQPDGIHPTARAQARMLDTVWPELEPLLDAQD
ncbi:arylesterase [Ectothiorhodospira mobilis]|nr:arylesterase [Ectothiorhodospira mobilis]